MSEDKPKKSSSKKTRNSEKCEFGALEDSALQNVHAQLMREKHEPTEKESPVPMFLIFLFAGMMFWAGGYLTRYSGNFRGDVFDPNWQPGGGAVKEEKPWDPVEEGRKLFAKNCQVCHQPTGLGVPGAYPPLVDSEWVTGDDTRIAKALLLGMSGPITVKGKQYNNTMPPFKRFSDQKLAAIMSYIRQAWGNKAPIVEEETVTKAREAIGSRSKPWSPAELLKEHPF
tara:strand:+ start:5188 stop:5868 length:681 start_codon:yes stop_codon:yes gene_type:complete